MTHSHPLFLFSAAAYFSYLWNIKIIRTMHTLRKLLAIAAAAVSFQIAASAQHVNVKGIVSDEAGEAIPGVFIYTGEHLLGTTDLDGGFDISVPAKNVIRFSGSGFATIETKVSRKSVYKVVMARDSEDIAYGKRRRSQILGSVARISGADLRQVQEADVISALRGRIPGVRIGEARPGDQLDIIIRGQKSLSASEQPLIVLDGIPFMGSLSDIPQDAVKSVTVLKDASETVAYGSRGANGVILIVTRVE